MKENQTSKEKQNGLAIGEDWRERVGELMTQALKPGTTYKEAQTFSSIAQTLLLANMLDRLERMSSEIQSTPLSQESETS